MWPTLAELGASLRARRLSPVEATEQCLERIRRLDPTINAFITVTADRALEQARAAAAELAAGRDRGPLHGVPIALKDLIDTAGVRTTAASALFEDRVPDEDAEVVRRLRAAGAVILGKLNLHEFAYGGSGVIGRFGAVRNPRSPAHIAGGSSSGSAAAVAAAMCWAAIGTDTAGSIRLPAAACGVVGLKPSYGLVSVQGIIPLAPSLDHVGPLARSVRDTALVLQAIAGDDHAAALEGDAPRPRVGVARAFFFADLDAEVAASMEQALVVLARLAADVRDVVVPVDDYRTVSLAESFAYHRRWVERSPERYQPETLRRILGGAGVSAADYIDRWQEMQRARRRAADLFADVDLIVTPTAPVPPPSFAEIFAQELRPRELVLLRNTRPFNVLGLPALSVPCGRTRSGLPIGLQIVGPPGGEAAVLRLGDAFERACGGPLDPA